MIDYEDDHPELQTSFYDEWDDFIAEQEALAEQDIEDEDQQFLGDIEDEDQWFLGNDRLRSRRLSKIWERDPDLEFSLQDRIYLELVDFSDFDFED